MADRLRVILYRAEGYALQSIAKLLQMSRNHVSKLLDRYRDGGLAAVLEPDQYPGSQPQLTQEQQQALKVELTTHIYVTALQVMAWIEAQWHVTYAEVSSMHKLLKRLGFTYKKNRLVPSKADPELQRLFVRWFQGLCAWLGPADSVYFGDAVHFKHNAEAGSAWSLCGEPHLIPANSGRQRYNVLGAYCVQTQEHVFLITEENIDQTKLAEFMTRLRAKHPGTGRIYLLLNNASYNHAQSVKSAAQQQAILESWIVAELLKSYWHNGRRPPFYYYRDKDQREVDLLLLQDGIIYPLEIKKSASPSREDVRHFGALERLGLPIGPGGVICLAEQSLPLTAAAQSIPAWVI